jgi:hypothetical protein
MYWGRHKAPWSGVPVVAPNCGAQGPLIGTPDKAIFTKVRTEVSVSEKALLIQKKERKKA